MQLHKPDCRQAGIHRPFDFALKSVLFLGFVIKRFYSKVGILKLILTGCFLP